MSVLVMRLIVLMVLPLVVLCGLSGCGSDGGDDKAEIQPADGESGSEQLVGYWETVTGLEQGMVFSFAADGSGTMQMGSFEDAFDWAYEPGEPGSLTISNPTSNASQVMQCMFQGDTLRVIRRGDTSAMVRRVAPPPAAEPETPIEQMMLGKWVVEVEGIRLEHTFRDDGTFVAVNLNTGQRLPGSWTRVEDDYVVMMIQGRPMKGRVSFDSDDTMILDTPNSKLVFERVP